MYRLVREHAATFVAHAARTYAAPLPRYVVLAFERYVGCGDYAHGFIRCHCDGCGHDVLVAFSCKQRGLCPSCGARRMASEAATITDRILPDVPIRQWVLSLPFELRRLAATKPDVLTALGRIFMAEIARVTKHASNLAGTETGSICFPQRFGGSLNAHLHYHVLALDGVFERHDAGVRFRDVPPPTKATLDELARRVRDRVLRWLRSHRYLDERLAEDRSNEPRPATAIDACTEIALASGSFLAKPFVSSPQEPGDRKERRFCARCDGFDIHCAVRIAAGDDAGRERLVRYCARPPFALERFELLRDGRVAYRVKTPRHGRSHRVMTPLELMARLAALIPPPFFPTIRYGGVLAPGSSWRKLVTRCAPAKPKACIERKPLAPSNPRPEPKPHPSVATAPVQAATTAPAPALLLAHSQPIAESEVRPATITVKHWQRLLDGELLATSRYVDWAVLLQRSFGFDALRCPKCDQKMRVVATLAEPSAVRRILQHLGMRANPLEAAPARDPTWLQTNMAFDAA